MRPKISCVSSSSPGDLPFPVFAVYPITKRPPGQGLDHSSFFCASFFLRLFLFAPPSGHSSVSRPPRPGRRKPPFAGVRSLRRIVFLRLRQGTFFRFPPPASRQAETAVCRRQVPSPNRGAGVITSAAGFGAEQAPSAPDRRPSFFALPSGHFPVTPSPAQRQAETAVCRRQPVRRIGVQG